MSELKFLENRLRSWTPRQPSPSLKARALTAAAPMKSSAQAEVAYLPPWRWWAPATALLAGLLTLLTGQINVLNFERGAAAHMLAEVALDQPNLVAYFPGAGHSAHNVWPSTSFEWTNPEYSAPTVPTGWHTNGSTN